LVKDDPRHITVMSGVSTKDEVVALRSSGADAVLVGKCLSSSLDPVAALRSLEVDR
jgi:indole-3-glycerol phosphate synthase